MGSLKAVSANGVITANVSYVSYNQLGNYSTFVINGFHADWDGEDEEEDYQENVGYFKETISYGSPTGQYVRTFGSFNAVNIEFKDLSSRYFTVPHGSNGNFYYGTVDMVPTMVSGNSSCYGYGSRIYAPTIPKNIRRLVAHGGEGEGSVQNNYVNYGNSVTLTAPNPTIGYLFSNWSNGDTNVSTTVVASTPQTQDYTAYYKERYWTLTTKAKSTYYDSSGSKHVEQDGNTDGDGEVTGTTSSGGTYLYWSEIPQSATCEDGENYHFVKWTYHHVYDDGSTSSETDGGSSKTVTVSTDPNKNTVEIVCTAYFEPNKYPIYTDYDHEHISGVSGAGTYDYKSKVTLSATAKDLCRFTKWTDNVFSNPRTVTVLKPEGETYVALGEFEYVYLTIETVRSCRVNNYTDLLEDNTSELVYIKIRIYDVNNLSKYPIGSVTCAGVTVNYVGKEGNYLYYDVKTTQNVRKPQYYYFVVRDRVKTYKHTVYVRAGLITLMVYQDKASREDVGVGIGVYPEPNIFAISGELDFTIPNTTGKEARVNVYEFLKNQFIEESIPYDSGILINAKVTDTNKWSCAIYNVGGEKFFKCCAYIMTTTKVYTDQDNIVLFDLSKYGVDFNSRMPVNIVEVGKYTVQRAVTYQGKIVTRGAMENNTYLYVDVWLPLITK